MRLSHRGLLAAAGATAIFSFAGCGGGGGGSSVSGGGSSTLGVYVTDAVNDDFKQVWVTLYKIEAKTETGDFVTLFDDPGKLINVRSLADASQLLNSVSIPAGEYKQVRITFGDHFSMVPKAGGAAVDVAVADDIGTHADGKVQIVVAAPHSAVSGQLSNLVVDFDLAATQLVGGKVRPSLKKGDDNHFQVKAKHAELEGVAQNVTASGFSLLHEGGRVITVHTTDKTEIFSAHTGAATQLVNGKKVEVKGDLDPATHEVTATSVKIIDDEKGDCEDCGENENARAQAFGSVASIDSENHFTVTLDSAEHFKPTGDSVHVVTTPNTKFKWPQHDAVSFGSLAVDQKVVVVGSLDPNTQTILARFVMIQPAH